MSANFGGILRRELWQKEALMTCRKVITPNWNYPIIIFRTKMKSICAINTLNILDVESSSGKRNYLMSLMKPLPIYALRPETLVMKLSVLHGKQKILLN